MDAYVQCPLDPSHRVLEARLPYHIVKCKLKIRQEDVPSKKLCPYDARHIVDVSLFNAHVSGCPHKTTVTSNTLIAPDEETKPIQAALAADLCPCDKDWDN